RSRRGRPGPRARAWDQKAWEKRWVRAPCGSRDRGTELRARARLGIVSSPADATVRGPALEARSRAENRDRTLPTAVCLDTSHVVERRRELGAAPGHRLHVHARDDRATARRHRDRVAAGCGPRDERADRGAPA